jgi:hypothetical protein
MWYVSVALLDKVWHWWILMIRFMAEFISGLDAVGESMDEFGYVVLVMVVLLWFMGCIVK